jgi:hypothetical protein
VFGKWGLMKVVRSPVRVQEAERLERERREAFVREERMKKAEEARQKAQAQAEAEEVRQRELAKAAEAEEAARRRAELAAVARAQEAEVVEEEARQKALAAAQAAAQAEAAARQAAELEAQQKKRRQERRQASLDKIPARQPPQQQAPSLAPSATAAAAPTDQQLPLKPFPRSPSTPEKTARPKQAAKAPVDVPAISISDPPISSSPPPRQAEGEAVDEEAEEEEEDDEPVYEGLPRFEYALTQHPHTILACLLSHLDYADFRPLRELSRTMRRTLNESEHREVVLVRYLSEFGYRPLAAARPLENGVHAGQKSRAVPRSRIEGNNLSSRGGGEVVELSLRDLEAFRTGLEFAPSEYHDLAREHRHAPLDTLTLRMVKACTRSWNKVVIRLRAQPLPVEGVVDHHTIGGGGKGNNKKSKASSSVARRAFGPKPGRAPILRVWAPTRANWMTDEEVVECEREVWRSGVWSHLHRGDIVHNVACGDFANEGKLISDSRYLRDLSYMFDPVGHLPVCLCLQLIV